MHSLDTSRLDRQALLFAALAILAMRLVALFDGRDPGHDMSMLMANVPLAGVADYFRPLPLFEQTTTLGHLFLIDTISHLFGAEGMARFHAVRVLAISAGLVGLTFMALTLSRFLPGRAIAVILLLAAFSETTQWSSTDAKQYVLEFGSSAFLLWAGLRYLEAPTYGHTLLFASGGLVTALVAFTAPVIIAFVGGAMLVTTLVRMREGKADYKAILHLAITGMLASAPAILLYFFYTRTVTELDFAAYAVRDVPSFINPTDPLSNHNLTRLMNFAGYIRRFSEPPFLHEIFEIHEWVKPIYRLLFVGLTIWGAVYLARRSVYLGAAIVLGPMICIILNALHLMPITAVRHFMFLIPIMVPAVGVGFYLLIQCVVRRMPEPLRSAPVFVVLCGFAVIGTVKASMLEERNVRHHLARVKADPAPIFLYYGGQPLIRALNPPLPDVFGTIPERSSRQAWVGRARDASLVRTSETYFSDIATALAGRSRAYMLFVHHWPELQNGGLGRWVDMAEAHIGPCARFDDVGSVLFDCRKTPR